MSNPISQKPFSKREALSFGFDNLKKNFYFLLPFAIAYSVLIIAIAEVYAFVLPADKILSGGFSKSFMYGATAAFLLSTMLSTLIFSLALRNAYLKLIDGQGLKLNNLFYEPGKFFICLLASLITLLVPILPGFILSRLMSLLIVFVSSVTTKLIAMLVILLITFVGTLIWCLRLKFGHFFILEKNLNLVEALKASFKITKNQVWNLLLLSLIFALSYFVFIFADLLIVSKIGMNLSQLAKSNLLLYKICIDSLKLFLYTGMFLISPCLSELVFAYIYRRLKAQELL